jgi:predicted nicotinamide N-methyase
VVEKVNPRSPTEHAGLTALLRRHLLAARAQRQRLVDCQGLELYLINPDFPQRDLSPEEFLVVLNYPAYWAFCWASGRVLARFILDHPEWVRGKRVLDFGSGSGVVGIAAARAGAREVVACDIDADALAATTANAELNQVLLTLRGQFVDCEGVFDLIVAADVLYDSANLHWLDRLVERAGSVLLADSRIRNFDHPAFQALGQWQSTTIPDLDESAEFRRVSVFAATPVAGSHSPA